MPGASSFPGWGVMALRAVLGLLFEMGSDVWKSCIFWRTFHVLPASVTPLLDAVDYGQVCFITITAFGFVLAGTWLAAYYF